MYGNEIYSFLQNFSCKVMYFSILQIVNNTNNIKKSLKI